MALEFQLAAFASHEHGQLVVNQLHHQLAWLDGGKHIHAQCLLLDTIGKGFGYLIVDIGIEQCTPDILKSLGYVDLGNLSFTFENLKGTLKSFT